MHVHLAFARWNPGYLYMDAGVIPVSSNGALDLLERSLNTGSYNESAYQAWGTHTNNGLMAMRLGVPILTEEIKLAAEVVVSVIDQRAQRGAFNSITAAEQTDNPTSVLVMLNLPVNAGALRVTPELAAVINRNYNRALEAGDHEILGGLSANYRINDGVSVSFFGGYGIVSNENSLVGSYGTTARSSDADPGDAASIYYSNGLLFSVGTSIKAGPGTFAFDFRFGSSYDDASAQTKAATKTNNIYIDPRYTWNVHPRFTIMPRWRVYVSTYDDGARRMENRPELIIGGSF
jgi:hypothetical protein